MYLESCGIEKDDGITTSSIFIYSTILNVAFLYFPIGAALFLDMQDTITVSCVPCSVDALLFHYDI